MGGISKINRSRISKRSGVEVSKSQILSDRSKLRNEERKSQRAQVRRFSLTLGRLALVALSWQGMAGLLLCAEDLEALLNSEDLAELELLIKKLGAPQVSH